MNVNSDNDNLTPQIGLEFNTVDEAWSYWINYGKQMGFSVRKGFVNKSRKDGRITTKGFVCSKEGVRRLDKRQLNPDIHRDETRTNCPVKLYISLVLESGKYRVYEFVAEHNHLLHLPHTTYMMRSQRNISEVQGFEIELAYSSGIKLKKAHELMSRQAGGRSNLGYTKDDHKYYLRTKREKDMEYGEAGSILKYFQEETTRNPSFNYSVQLDNEEQITNIFWADARMLIDYIYFGDVITFDTTYGTNKALRPLAVFTGFNHHRGIIVFGAALLYDETVASFEWLFNTFLAAHNGKMPQTIFTDQDAAMAKAISGVMPNTVHGLCSWHIMQNVIKHLAYLQKRDDSTIIEEFMRCMFHYENTFEFEEAWDKMNDKYNTHENTWLQGIYGLKKKWAKCYLKHVFTLGCRSTQASESMNSDVKDNLQSDVSIAKFFGHFERVVQDKRHNELKSEFESREKSPTLAYKNSPMLRQASKVYTPNIFRMFQKQLDRASAATIVDSNMSKEVEEYKIHLLNRDGEWVVLFDPKDNTITCNCGLFSNLGILCCHALKVYDRFDVKYIPEAYILKRWTRMAKSGYTEDNGQIIVEDFNLQLTERYRSLCPRMIRLASRASEDKKTFAMVVATIEELEKKIDDQLTLKQDTNCDLIQNEQPSQPVMGNVQGLKKRVVGRKGGKRPLSFLERQLKGKGKRTSKNISKDDVSCSQTPTNNMEMQGQMPMSISTFQSPLVHRPETSFLELLSGQIFNGSIQSSQRPYDFMDLQ